MDQQRLQTEERHDVHNASVDAVVAQAGLCAFMHLSSGKTCILRERHVGPCHFISGSEAQVRSQHAVQFPRH